MDKNKYEFIDNANLFLGNVTGYADKAFENLQGASQTTVDVAAAEAAYAMSIAIEGARRAFIWAAHGLYEGQLKIKNSPIGKLANMSITDPLALLEPVLAMQQIICAPYYEALTIITELTPKVMEFSNNIQKIANYQPPALTLSPSDGTFRLQLGKVTMGEIISGTPNKVDIKKPDIDKIRENAKKKKEENYVANTAYRAEAQNDPKTTIVNPNSVTIGNQEGTEVTQVTPGIAAAVEDEVYGAKDLSASSLQRISELEVMFGYSNAGMPITYRLSQLEYKVNGHYNLALPISSLQARLDAIERNIKLQSEEKRLEKKAEDTNNLLAAENGTETPLNNETMNLLPGGNDQLAFINNTFLGLPNNPNLGGSTAFEA